MKNSPKIWILLSLFCIAALLAVVNLVKNSDSLPTISYYHWKNHYTIPTSKITEAKPHQLYIKYLDIGYSNQIEAIKTRFSEQPPDNTIPVVYIDNRVLKQGGIEPIIKLIHEAIPNNKYQALQIDCDWSLSTKKTYFHLLHQLKQSYPNLSATIRLHQIKYFEKTGVPPVSYGVLMYYNMSDIRDVNTKNYILDLEIAEKYHFNFENYPLPLELALPLYYQIRVIRQNKTVMILTDDDWNQDKIEAISNSRYRVKTAHYLQGTYLYKGDILVEDRVTPAQLQKAATTLSSLIQPKEVIFYELKHAKDFGYENLESIRRIFN